MSDILLANYHTERRLMRGEQQNMQKVDRIRKKAIVKMMQYFPDE